MFLILFCLSSILIARYLKKHYKTAAILHFGMFVVLGLGMMFASTFQPIQKVLTVLFGSHFCQIVSSAISQPIQVICWGYSALLVIEFVVIVSSVIVATKLAIQLVKSISAKKIKQTIVYEKPNVSIIKFNSFHLTQNKNLQFCRLLN